MLKNDSINFEKKIQIFENIFGKGEDFALKFLKDPLKFCESNSYKIYHNISMGSYILIHEINYNTFAFIDLYDGGFTSMVVEKEQINKLINSSGIMLLIDKEIFLIWLKDNLDIFEREYKRYSNSKTCI